MRPGRDPNGSTTHEKKRPAGRFFSSGSRCDAQWLRRCLRTTIHRGALNRTMLMYSHT